LKRGKEIFEKEQRFYIDHVGIERKSFSMLVYIEKIFFFVYRNVGVQRKKKAFLIDSDGCIVFCKHVEEKMKQKEKRKKDLEGRHVMVIGSTNHS